jgi:hypothetical protein
VTWRSSCNYGSSPVGRLRRPLEHSPVESAQFGFGCREVSERAGQCPHVVVEYVAIDVADAVASLVVAGVIAFPGLPAPFLGLPRRLPVGVAGSPAARHSPGWAR